MALVETLTAVCREFSNWHLLIEEVPGRRTQLPGSIFSFHYFDRNHRNQIKVSHAHRLDLEVDRVSFCFLSLLSPPLGLCGSWTVYRGNNTWISVHRFGGFLEVNLSGQTWGFE